MRFSKTQKTTIFGRHIWNGIITLDTAAEEQINSKNKINEFHVTTKSKQKEKRKKQKEKHLLMKLQINL